MVLVIMFMLFPSFPIRKHSSFCSDDYAYGLLFMSYTTCHAFVLALKIKLMLFPLFTIDIFSD